MHSISPMTCPAFRHRSEAVDQEFDNAPIPHRFTFRTDYTEPKPFSVDRPKSLRAMLGGSEGSLMNLWGGEFEWDNYRVIHHRGR